MAFPVERLKEPSTWRGLAVLAGVLGVNISPEQSTAIMTVVGLIYGVIQTFRKEKK
jgi:hypothetical protein